jgi:hypothetical protein
LPVACAAGASRIVKAAVAVMSRFMPGTRSRRGAEEVNAR